MLVEFLLSEGPCGMEGVEGVTGLGLGLAPVPVPIPGSSGILSFSSPVVRRPRQRLDFGGSGLTFGLLGLDGRFVVAV